MIQGLVDARVPENETIMMICRFSDVDGFMSKVASVNRDGLISTSIGTRIEREVVKAACWDLPA